MEEKKKNYLTLKRWTLKERDFSNSEKWMELLREYNSIGSSASAMSQRDTPRQKKIICELIDLCDWGRIYLDWDWKNVRKKVAKEYVMNYS